MSQFSLLVVAAMTVAGASSLVTRTRLTPPTADKANRVDRRSAETVLLVGPDARFDKGIASEMSTLIVLALFSLAGLLASLTMIAACHCDLSASALN